MRKTSVVKTLATALVGLCAANVAYAANYGLIMTIGEYSDPRASLPGIDLDAKLAAKIATSMGIPQENLIQVHDRKLTLSGIDSQLKQLEKKIGRGDNVFIYYSGHGGQHAVGQQGACAEGMISFDMKTYDDSAIEASLASLANKAGQLVMMNDSCFSGGQATKSPDTRSLDRVAKNWAPPSAAGYQCGNAVNTKMTRNLVPTASRLGANFLYIAAASEKEVAFATRNGSSATVAWASCFEAKTDEDNSGLLTGKELQKCAQSWINQNRFNQTITLIGNPDLPLAFLSANEPGLANQRANPLVALQALQQQSSPAIKVVLEPRSTTLRIRQDFLDLKVQSNSAGYLYLFHVGSDQSTFDLLFPNDRDQNNYITPGEVLLPRASWGIQAGGPPGTNHLMAVVSESPRNFDSFMQSIASSPFKSVESNRNNTRNLTVVGTGQNLQAPGRIGVSSVVQIREIP